MPCATASSRWKSGGAFQAKASASRAWGARSRRAAPAAKAASTARASTASDRSSSTRTTGRLRAGSTPKSGRWMVLPLTCTVNCEAPITVARMRSAGSTSGTDRPLRPSTTAWARSMAMSPCDCASWLKMYSATPPETVTNSGSNGRASGSVSCSFSPSRSIGAPRMRSTATWANRWARARRAAGSANVSGDASRPMSAAASWAASSMRVQAPVASCATSRPPTAKAATPSTSPRSSRASLVVPPPMSTCSPCRLRRRE